MTTKEKIQNLIATLRSLPEDQRKLLLFLIIGALAALFLIIGVQITKIRVGEIGKNIRALDFGQIQPVNLNFQLPELESNIIIQNPNTDMTATTSEAQTTNVIP